MCWAKAGISRRRLEPLEPQDETIPVGIILGTGWQVEGPPVQLLEGLEHLAVMLIEQAFRNVQPVIWVDPDQVCIERGVMDLGEWRPLETIGWPRRSSLSEMMCAASSSRCSGRPDKAQRPL